MDFLNKVIFISKKLIMEDGKVFFDNYFVTVKSINGEVLIASKANGEDENFPSSLEFYEKADAGLYELNDGTSYENPDFIGEFLIFENDTAYEKFKDQH